MENETNNNNNIHLTHVDDSAHIAVVDDNAPTTFKCGGTTPTIYKYGSRLLRVPTEGEPTMYSNLAEATQGMQKNVATMIRKAVYAGNEFRGAFWYVEVAEPEAPKPPTFTIAAISHIRFPPRPRLEPTPEEINECYVMLRQLYLGQLQEIPEMFRYDPVPQNKRGILAPTIHDARRAAYIKLGQQYAESVKDGLYVVADDGRYQFEELSTAAKVLVVAAAAITPSGLRQKRLGEYVIEVVGENATAAWNELLAELEKYE